MSEDTIFGKIARGEAPAGQESERPSTIYALPDLPRRRFNLRIEIVLS